MPIFAQKVALKALELKETIAKKLRDVFKRRIEIFSTHIDREKFEYVPPQGAFYVFLKAKKRISSINLAYKLASKGVGVLPGIIFGRSYDSYVRLSLTCSERKIVEGLRRLSESI